jgi:hypothetical protein
MHGGGMNSIVQGGAANFGTMVSNQAYNLRLTDNNSKAHEGTTSPSLDQTDSNTINTGLNQESAKKANTPQTFDAIDEDAEDTLTNFAKETSTQPNLNEEEH